MDKETYGEMYDLESRHWWFVGKRMILNSLLERFTSRSSNLDLLDIGCGTGMIMHLLQKFGRVSGIDISDKALDFCKQRGLNSVFSRNAECTEFPSESFDVVTAMDIIEHVDNDRNIVEEISRLLKPNGIAIISVPAFMWLWSGHDDAFHHKRRYTKKTLQYAVSGHGLSIDYISYTNFFIFPIVVLARILGKILGWSNKRHTDFFMPFSQINWLLIKLYALELVMKETIKNIVRTL